MRSLSMVGTLILAFTFTGTQVRAQTPDSTTPANEGVCDPVKANGVTKGLYGICIAFCEAQDCEAVVDAATGEVTLDPSCTPSSLKLYNNYATRMTASDPPLPCVNIATGECPCWSATELASIADGGTLGCSARAPFLYSLTGTDAFTGKEDRVFLSDTTADIGPHCGYREHTPETNRSISITRDEVIACTESIKAECASRGFPLP